MDLDTLPKKCILTENVGHWYDVIDGNGLTMWVSTCSSRPSIETTNKIRSYANKLFDNEIYLWEREKYHNPQLSSCNYSLLSSMILEGTFADKIRSMVAIIKNKPLHGIKYIEDLVKMCSKKSRRESIMAVDALKSLFIEYLLPDRNLNKFYQWDFSKYYANGTEDKCIKNSKELLLFKKLLIYAVFEEKLISIYDTYINHIVMHSKDPIAKVRSKVIGIMYDLLSEKPQAEQRLLTEIINKIGDVDRTTSSHAAYMITKLLKKHNKMAINVVDDARSFILRRDTSSRAKYLCICLINQIVLSNDDSFLANNLIILYMTFFKGFSENLEKIDNKVLSSLLTGINRALPFTTQESSSNVENHINIVFKIFHIGSFVVCTQSLVLLFQILQNKPAIQDRYYQALYESISQCPSHQGNTIMNVYLNVLFKSIIYDSNPDRIIALIKRILQVCLHCSAPFVGSVLLNIAKLSKKLLPIKNCNNNFSKEKLEIIENIPDDLKKKLDSGLFDDDDENEYFEDVDKKKIMNNNISYDKNSFSHENLFYDPNKRNPKFSNAKKTSLFELNLLQRYYHKTISHFIKQLSTDNTINYFGDPFIDLTSTKFFEKFSTKTPKKKITECVSIMTRKIKPNTYRIVTNRHVLDKPIKSLTPEEKIFYDYYYSKMKCSTSGNTRKRRQRAFDSDDENFTKHEFNKNGMNDNGSDLEWTELFREKIAKKKSLPIKSSDDDSFEDSEDDADFSNGSYDNSNEDNSDMSAF